MENQNKNQNTGENLAQEETFIGGASRTNPSAKKSKFSTIGLIAVAVILAVVIAIILNQ